MNKIIPYIILSLLAVISLTSSIYMINEHNQALIFQFGEVIKEEKKPGLHLKIPFIQDIKYFDKRVLNIVSDEKEVIAKDRKRLIINAYAKYKITDPKKYYKTVRDETILRTRLNSILDPSLRQIIGEMPFSALLSDERQSIMQRIKTLVNISVEDFGIDVIDVRILRADLPRENSNAVYERMKTDRAKEAKEFRAQGAEEAEIIKSMADRDVTILLADAKKQASILKGTGDALSSKIFSDSYLQDPEFFYFYRSLQAYKESFGKDNTKLIISPNNRFLKFLDN